MTMRQDGFEIETLGPCTRPAPVQRSFYQRDDQGVVLDSDQPLDPQGRSCPVLLEQAGPRERIYFAPEQVNAAIVTCGGLCPGLNDVIRGLTMVLWYRYGVKSIRGIRYGYAGMIPGTPHEPVMLNPALVEDIHKDGGTILGSSRGPQDTGAMVDYLVANGINMLFTIGGDGTQRGALDLFREAQRRGIELSVVGIPKTIDNDLHYTDRTFGFTTAVAMSKDPIECAHNEAKGVFNGVGLVKLMGRHSGFVAAYAALASSDVNLVLVPEVPFTLDKLMDFLEDRFRRKTHAVIVVAEGAGQDLVPVEGWDKSGNKRLGDIGVFLRDTIKVRLQERGTQTSIKYIDPSYIIRSAPANAVDSTFCFMLAQNAVHAAMAGRTGMVISLLNSRYVHVPIAKATEARKLIDPHSALWESVLDNTGQPELT